MIEKWDQLAQNKDVDTSKTTHISLCSGYGGIDLGLKRVIPSLRTIAYAEIEAFAIECLLARMEGGQLDAAPIWSDLKSFPWAEFSRKVDILSGGYPCQPFSSAGKRGGADDPRHLWPFIANGIRILRPRVCFFENVEGHISLGLSSVISDLEEMGYKVSWGIFSASECGAPHQRKRVFIMAHSSGEGLQGDITRLLVQGGRQMPSGSTPSGCGSSGSWELADSNGTGSGQDWESSEPRTTSVKQPPSIEGRGDAREVRERQAWPSRPGEPQHAWEPPRVVGNAESGARLGRASGNKGHAAQPNQSLGNASNARRQGGRGANDPGWQVQRSAEPDGSGSNGEMESRQRQTQPALGGNADGSASGLDYAELCVTCDNRTDELRLLGNGVVPATAALAFITLFNELSKGSA